MKLQLLAAITACGALLNLPAYADDAPAAADATSLKANIKTSVLHTGQEVKDMGDALRQLKHAATELYGEVTRQELVVMGSPDVIGNMVIPAIPDQVLPMGGYLPPRKKWIDFCMAHISQLIPLLKEEVNDIAPSLHPETQDEGNALLPEFNKQLQVLEDHYQKLQALTSADKYDNTAIANESVTITDTVNKLDKMRKQLWKAVKKEAS